MGWALSTRIALFKTTRTGKKQYRIPKILVDTGSEYTWIPEATLERIGVAREKKDLPFVMANGQQITRSVGFAIIRIGEYFTTDEVVFAEKGDLLLLGARTLEGLNLVVVEPTTPSAPTAVAPRHFY